MGDLGSKSPRLATGHGDFWKRKGGRGTERIGVGRFQRPIQEALPQSKILTEGKKGSGDESQTSQVN